MVWEDILRILFALVAVLGMIGLCALAARKAGLMTASGGFNSKRRLALVETLALDARRRLAIIRCDETEHLIVLGANGETMVEQNLAGPAPVTEMETDAALGEPASPTQQKNPFAVLDAFKERAAKSRANAA